ncbi:MAG: hotdog fold thioesterase [Bacteriovoracia bacterium]
MKLQIVDLEFLNSSAHKTLLGPLGIKITKLTEDSIEGTMPVDARTHQPYGLLHGGASVALAETLGSIGANLCVNQKEFYCVGLDINANHVSGVRSGTVTGVARPLHVGRSTQVWEIRITSDENKLVCISRLTMAVVAIRKDP